MMTIGEWWQRCVPFGRTYDENNVRTDMRVNRGKSGTFCTNQQNHTVFVVPLKFLTLHSLLLTSETASVSFQHTSHHNKIVQPINWSNSQMALEPRMSKMTDAPVHLLLVWNQAEKEWDETTLWASIQPIESSMSTAHWRGTHQKWCTFCAPECTRDNKNHTDRAISQGSFVIEMNEPLDTLPQSGGKCHCWGHRMEDPHIFHMQRLGQKIHFTVKNQCCTDTIKTEISDQMDCTHGMFMSRAFDFHVECAGFEHQNTQIQSS